MKNVIKNKLFTLTDVTAIEQQRLSGPTMNILTNLGCSYVLPEYYHPY